jgi:hypothetical protein
MMQNAAAFDFFAFFDTVVDSSADAYEKLLSLIIARHIGKDGQAAFPSRERMIKQASCSMATFKRSQAALSAFFDSQPRRGKATLYAPRLGVTADEIEAAIMASRAESRYLTDTTESESRVLPEPGSLSTRVLTAPTSRVLTAPTHGIPQSPHNDPLKDPVKKEECPNGHLALDEPKPTDVKKLSSAAAARMAFDRYNDMARRLGLPVANVLTDARKVKIVARIREAGGMAAFENALANVERSAFLQGRNDSGFRADFDFICQAKSFSRLMDGGYGNGAHAKAPLAVRPPGMPDKIWAEIQEKAGQTAS